MARDDEDSRWPRRLYQDGAEPDPRFTLANERTFLAWIRTALALMAGGVGIEALNAVSGHPDPLRTALAVLLLLAGTLCSATAFTRWMITERALRLGRPLPAPRLAPVLGYGLGVIGLLACVLVFLTGW
ncbi:YidH family protein [Saccharopolyspora thermophila]|nr:DUF202 domain-containing protein [Saccharopolyspora subtropica]